MTVCVSWAARHLGRYGRLFYVHARMTSANGSDRLATLDIKGGGCTHARVDVVYVAPQGPREGEW